LQTHLSEAYTDAYGRAIKLRRSGLREIYVSNIEIETAYDNIRESVKPLFKLLVYSGVRLSQARHTYQIKNGLKVIAYPQTHYESGISTS